MLIKKTLAALTIFFCAFIFLNKELCCDEEKASVVAIKREQGFVIIDAGEKSGIRTGDTLSIYRGGKKTAVLKIARADEKFSVAYVYPENQILYIKLGDAVSLRKRLLPMSRQINTVVLKSGQTLEGKIAERNQRYITMNFEGVPLTYFLEDIESIDGEKIRVPRRERIQKAEPPISPCTEGSNAEACFREISSNLQQGEKFFNEADNARRDQDMVKRLVSLIEAKKCTTQAIIYIKEWCKNFVACDKKNQKTLQLLEKQLENINKEIGAAN
jgi:hypothetical protein